MASSAINVTALCLLLFLLPASQPFADAKIAFFEKPDLDPSGWSETHTKAGIKQVDAAEGEFKKYDNGLSSMVLLGENGGHATLYAGYGLELPLVYLSALPGYGFDKINLDISTDNQVSSWESVIYGPSSGRRLLSDQTTSSAPSISYVSQILTGLTDIGTAAYLSPDGSRLADASNGQNITMYVVRGDVYAAEAISAHVITNPKISSPIVSLSWSPDNDAMVIALKEGTVAVLYLNDDKLSLASLQILDPPSSWLDDIFFGYVSGHVNIVAWSPDGKTIAAGYKDNSAVAWSLGAEVHTFYGVQVNATSVQVLDGPQNVISFSWAPHDGSILAAANGAEDESIAIWSLGSAGALEPSPRLISTDTGGNTTVVAYSPDGSLLAASAYGVKDFSSFHHEMRIFNASDAANATHLLLDDDYHNCWKNMSITWSPDGSTVELNCVDPRVSKMWRVLANGTLETIFRAQSLEGYWADNTYEYTPPANASASQVVFFEGPSTVAGDFADRGANQTFAGDEVLNTLTLPETFTAASVLVCGANFTRYASNVSSTTVFKVYGDEGACVDANLEKVIDGSSGEQFLYVPVAQYQRPAYYQQFKSGEFDLQNTTVVFRAPSYLPCVTPNDGHQFPEPFNQATSLDDMWPRDGQTVKFTQGFSFRLFGEYYTEAHISAHGHITFGEPQNGNLYSSNFFNFPRVSALYTELDPSKDEQGSVYYQQLPDRFIVTYKNVLVRDYEKEGSSFQIVLLEDGTVRITYLDVDVGGAWPVTGISGHPNVAKPTPTNFTEATQCANCGSEYKLPACPPAAVFSLADLAIRAAPDVYTPQAEFPDVDFDELLAESAVGAFSSAFLTELQALLGPEAVIEILDVYQGSTIVQLQITVPSDFTIDIIAAIQTAVAIVNKLFGSSTVPPVVTLTQVVSSSSSSSAAVVSSSEGVVSSSAVVVSSSDRVVSSSAAVVSSSDGVVSSSAEVVSSSDASDSGSEDESDTRRRLLSVQPLKSSRASSFIAGTFLAVAALGVTGVVIYRRQATATAAALSQHDVSSLDPELA